MDYKGLWIIRLFLSTETLPDVHTCTFKKQLSHLGILAAIENDAFDYTSIFQGTSCSRKMKNFLVVGYVKDTLNGHQSSPTSLILIFM